MKTTLSKAGLLILILSAGSSFAQQIPLPLQGKWGASKTVCAELLAPKSESETGLVISASAIVIGMESTCEVQKGSKFDGKELTAAYRCSVEGDSAIETFKLTLLDANKMEMKSTAGSQKYMRCK